MSKKPYRDPATTKIEDWKWRDLPEVQKSVPIKDIPDYIQQGYGEFMNQQLARAQAGQLTPRDLLKAYTITQSSIGRGGLPHSTATKTGMKLPNTGTEVRPEGAFAEWLGSPEGQQYLDAAERGQIHQGALLDIQQKFAPFGKQNQLADQMMYAAHTVPGMSQRLNKAITGSKEDYRNWAEQLKGIAGAKSGFIGSMLGRGDLPTLDARQLNLHALPADVGIASIMNRGKGKGAREAVDRLIARQHAMDLAVDPSMKPHYQHLSHHAVWDAMGNNQTTHEDIIRAMRGYDKGGNVEPSQDEMRLALTKHGMYSPMEKAAMAVPRTKGTPAEFLAEASKQPGFRKEELEDRPIPTPQQKMTKQEFLTHLKQTPQPQITKKVIRDISGEEYDALHDKIANAKFHDDYDMLSPAEKREVRQQVDNMEKTEYGQYQLPGGENYREVLLQLPQRGLSPKEVEAKMWLEANARRGPLDPQGAQRLAQLAEKAKSAQPDYQSSHWRDNPNVLAHMRMSDRMTPEGKKLLHLEEIQSDWHQEGRKKGYQQKAEKNYTDYLDGLHSRVKENVKNDMISDGMSEDKALMLGQRIADKLSSDPRKLADYLGEADKQMALHEARIKERSAVPNAPFKKSWHELALKHALHEAAKGGYHGVVITPGQKQADRYDLSKHINDLQYDPQTGALKAWDHNGVEVVNKTNVSPEQISDYIGKEGAQKLMEKNSPVKQLFGADLKVGGEGMKGFYDKIVPDYLNKLGKPHGVTVGQMPLDQATQLHHFPITEPMRASILKEGLPMYHDGGMIHKAEGGTVATVEQMKAQLMHKQIPMGLSQLQSVGANEAPSLGVKTYIPPHGRFDNGQMPVGGIDENVAQPGQQMMPQQPQMPAMNQVPQGDRTNILDGTGAPPGPNNNPPPGMPGGSNILQMTPQGQAMAAMRGGQQQPQPPQGLAKGGQPKKPLHYAPSPALMKAEIESHAERMARQMTGLDNPNQKTLQQLAREQNLPVDIRKGGKKQDVPVIDWEQQKGAYSVGVPGDPSRGGLVPTPKSKKRLGLDMPKAGEYLHAIGGEKLESPVPMYGGKDYGAYGHPEGWASDLGASAGMFNVVKRLEEEDPNRKILGHYHKMSPESLNHAIHMMDAVLSYHQPHKAEPERINMLNHLMRNVATTTSKSDVPYPEFPGFENPNDVMFHGSMNSGMRKKIIGLLGKEKLFPGGKQKLEDLIYAVSHPELRNIETGAGGSSILEFDPSRELRKQISSHPTYGHDIPSKLIGRSKYIVPAEILAPRSMHNAVQEIQAMGKKVVPFNQAKMNIIREPIDEQYINQMGEYENAMRKRLGYKKGGGVKLHADQDTMSLELSRKPKKVK